MKYLKYPCSFPNHLLIVELLFFRFGNEEIHCVLTRSFPEVAMLGVPVVEWLNVVYVHV